VWLSESYQFVNNNWVLGFLIDCAIMPRSVANISTSVVSKPIMDEQTERDMCRQLMELAQKVIGGVRALVPEIGPLITKFQWRVADRHKLQDFGKHSDFCPQKLDYTHAARARKLYSRRSPFRRCAHNSSKDFLTSISSSYRVRQSSSSTVQFNLANRDWRPIAHEREVVDLRLGACGGRPRLARCDLPQPKDPRAREKKLRSCQ
jgi:hypothetical protein